MNKKEPICKQLDAFIDDEIKAVSEYDDFRLEFYDAYPSAIVKSLAIDEDKHANLLREIKAKVCG